MNETATQSPSVTPPAVPERASRWYVRAVWALATALAGAALTTLLVLLLRESEANRFTARFYRRAALLIDELRHDFEMEVDLTHTIASVWDVSEAFREPIFAHFVDVGLSVNSSVIELGYLTRVPALGRAAFENPPASSGGAGHPIVEPGAEGTLVPALRRPDHFPVADAAATPWSRTPTLVHGLDFAAFPDCLAAIERAKRTGTIQSAGHSLLFVFVPLYGGEPLPTSEEDRDIRFEGITVAVVRMLDRITDAVHSFDHGEIRLHLWLQAEGAADSLIYSSDRQAGDAPRLPVELLQNRHAYLKEWELAGQHWRVVALPTPGATERDGARWSWLALAAGLALTVFGTLTVARSTRERRRLTREVSQFWELSAELLCVTDRGGVLRRVNPAWETLLGSSDELLLGHTLPELLHDDDRAAAVETLAKLRRGRVALQFDGRLRASNGHWRWFQWSVAPDEDGEAFHGVARDVTEQRQTLAEMEKRATIDPLTNVLTRRALFERLGLEIRRAKRYGIALSLAVLDLDHFKKVNDRHGHATGDELLRRLGQLLRKALRDTDIAGRFGGDEFVVVMPQTGLDDARKAAARILRSFHDRGAITAENGAVIPLRCSIGVASLGPAIKDAMALVEQADAALYLAKRKGRGGIE